MSEVSLIIGGRSYKVACADGEEAHVTRLGEAIDAKLQSMAQLSPQDTQNLLFGALLLADELHDLRNSGTAALGAVDEARAEAERHKSEAEAAKAEAERLSAQLAEAGDHEQALEALRGELEELRQAEAEVSKELRTAQKAEAELREQLAAAVSRTAAPALPLTDPDLAPALEQFAELLESCADKLEGHASAS